MTPTQPLLAERDAHFLRSLLASKDHDDSYMTLLNRKLSEAKIVADDALDAQIATIDSRVDFSVGGGFTEHRVLTRSELEATNGLALPVTTMRGLALLGLRENEIVSVRKPNGIIEPIRLIRVAYQPQAAKRRAGGVVQFQPRWKEALAGGPGDDPGPSAA